MNKKIKMTIIYSKNLKNEIIIFMPVNFKKEYPDGFTFYKEDIILVWIMKWLTDYYVIRINFNFTT